MNDPLVDRGEHRSAGARGIDAPRDPPCAEEVRAVIAGLRVGRTYGLAGRVREEYAAVVGHPQGVSAHAEARALDRRPARRVAESVEAGDEVETRAPTADDVCVHRVAAGSEGPAGDPYAGLLDQSGLEPAAGGIVAEQDRGAVLAVEPHHGSVERVDREVRRAPLDAGEVDRHRGFCAEGVEAEHQSHRARRGLVVECGIPHVRGDHGVAVARQRHRRGERGRGAVDHLVVGERRRRKRRDGRGRRRRRCSLGRGRDLGCGRRHHHRCRRRRHRLAVPAEQHRGQAHRQPDDDDRGGERQRRPPAPAGSRSPQLWPLENEQRLDVDRLGRLDEVVAQLRPQVSHRASPPVRTGAWRAPGSGGPRRSSLRSREAPPPRGGSNPCRRRGRPRLAGAP